MSRLVVSVTEKLAHKPGHKQTRLAVWTACGKRISTARLVLVTRGEAVERSYTVCECAS